MLLFIESLLAYSVAFLKSFQSVRFTRRHHFAVSLLFLINFYVSAIPNVTRLSPDNGLSQGVVYTMKLDSVGQLWLATESDLDHFDGTSVGHIRSLLNLSNDIVWDFEFITPTKLQIASADLGLIELDLKTQMPNYLQKKNMKLPSRTEAIHLIRKDQQQKLWYANSLSVYQIDDKGNLKETLTFTGKNPDIHHIRDLLVIDDILIIATSTGLYRFNTKNNELQELYYLPEDADANQMNSKSLIVHDGHLLIGTVQGLYRLSVEDLKSKSGKVDTETFLPELNIWKIKSSHRHNLLLATNIGLLKLDLNKVKEEILFQPGATTFEFSDDTILDFIELNDGTFWLGSRGDGAYLWNSRDTGFLNIYNRPGRNKLSHNFVFGLYASDSELWVGTQNGLNRYDWNDGSIEQLLVKSDKSAIESDTTIYGIYPDKSGRYLWLLGGESLSKFDTSTKQVISKSSGQNLIFFNQYFHSVVQTKDHELLALNKDGAFSVSNNDSVSPLANLSKTISEPTQAYWFGMDPDINNHFYYFYQGAIWLYQLEEDQAKLIYKVPKHLDNQSLYAEGVQKVNQSLWFLISGLGLVELDSENLKPKSTFFDATNTTLTTSTLYALQKDNFGYLWMSSHSGLWRFNPQTQFIRQFTNRSGLAYNEFNGSSSYFSSKHQKMVFGSLRGVSIFDPGHFVTTQQSTSSLYFSEISLESRKLATELIPTKKQKLELTHNDYGLKVQVSLFNYLQHSEITYSFDLSGPMDLPAYVKTQPQLSLPNLLPGNYTLAVKAFDSSSEQYSAPALMQIKVAYPPWASPFAYTCYFLFVLSVVSFWLRSKMKQRNLLLQQHHVMTNVKNKLQLALSVTSSDAWEADITNGIMAYSNRLPLIFGTNQSDISVSDYLSKIHPDDSASYLQSWQALRDGESDEFVCIYRVKTINDEWCWFKDVGKLSAVNQEKQHLIYGMYTDITTQKLTELELEQLSNYDQITGLPNRNLLNQYLAESDNNEQFHAFIVLKLLQFTEIKNAFGDLAANSLLLQVSSRLRGHISTPDLLIHASESLFIVALHSNNSSQLVQLSEQLISEINSPITVFEQQITISCIAGTACQTTQQESSQELLKQAEIAVRVARESGSYQHYSYKTGLLEQTKQKFILQQQLRDAIATGKLVNHYQPIVNAETGLPVGMELLLRWNNNGNFVPPDIFIPIAEQTGLIDELTCSSVAAACHDLKTLQHKGHNLYLSVNFTATQLCSHLVLMRLDQILKAHDISPTIMRIEITESSLIQNKEHAIQNMNELRNTGFQIYLDDFGTGYSSLKYIQDFPLDAIKIDKSFVFNISKNKNAAIIDTIITLADSLNVICIAEGVETELQRDYLLSKNCRFMQGYLYSKPLSLEQLCIKLQSLTESKNF